MTTATASVLVKQQVKTFRRDYMVGDKARTIIATVRYDDQCGNGHNTFSITGETYTGDHRSGESTVKHESGRTLWLDSCGCIHDKIAKHFKQLEPLIKWHLCTSDGPHGYVGNTIYFAGDRDHWGLRKGEVRQIKNGRTGKPSWKLEATETLEQYLDADECPPATATLRYVPWTTTGEGKERELDKARSAAIWPDATDDELMADDLKAKLEARLPALMVEFRAAVESLGFIY